MPVYPTSSLNQHHDTAQFKPQRFIGTISPLHQNCFWTQKQKNRFHIFHSLNSSWSIAFLDGCEVQWDQMAMAHLQFSLSCNPQCGWPGERHTESSKHASSIWIPIAQRQEIEKVLPLDYLFFFSMARWAEFQEHFSVLLLCDRTGLPPSFCQQTHTQRTQGKHLYFVN